LPIFGKWYKYKKPILQIRILKSIALEGELSKRKLQEYLDTHYSDISDAVNILQKRKIIEVSYADFKSRRAEIYYKLTKRGLEVIVDEFSEPEIFWKAMISYCKLSKHPISGKEFARYYKPFEAKYLGFHQSHEFFFQSDFVNKLFEEWLIVHDYNNVVSITISQKVLECIALHRSVTLEQIIKYLQAQKAKYEDTILKAHRKEVGNQNAQPQDMRLPDSLPESQLKRENDVLRENIMKVIDSYTLSSNYSVSQISEISQPAEIIAQYSEFINHLLIHVIEDKTGKRYELTLFGVILILAIVYYKTYDPSKIYFNELLVFKRLDYYYYDNYYKIVVSNYKDKLPLIFAKWPLLLDVFGSTDILARNFLQVFDKEIRTKRISLPVNMGGVKELYKNMYKISHHRYSKLTEMHESGLSALEICGKDTNRMSCLNETLSDIELLIVSADLKHFMEYIADHDYSRIYQKSIITALENSFANEISFLFYIVLARKAVSLPESGDEYTMPSRQYESMMHSEYAYKQKHVAKPRDLLLWILKRDHEIKDRFMLWIEDSIVYERQIINNMLNLQCEVLH
jgi:DNA-binding MarR family transcriptional regulator